MKMNELVTSLETSQRLKALGAEQYSYFQWGALESRPVWLLISGDTDKKQEPFERGVACFTAEELGKLLTEQELVFSLDNLRLCRSKEKEGYEVDHPFRGVKPIRATSIAEALGLLLIKVLEATSETA